MRASREISLPIRLLLLLALATIAAGCQPRAKSARAAATYPRIEVCYSENLRTAWARELRRLAVRGEYDQVDSVAAALRLSHERWENGWLKLGSLYYEGFGELGESESEGQWRALVAKLEAWRTDRPQSLTAPVALAYAYTGWAWHARGGGYSVTVTKDGAARFAQRLARARRVLGEAQHLAGRDPYWYSAMQTVALGEGWPRELYERVYAEGAAADPACWMLHKKKAYFLLPRWFGEDGEWEEFALAVSNAQPDSDRTALYAEIVWYLDAMHGNVFTETEASWYRTWQGFDELTRRRPGSHEIASEYAKLATLAGDRERARAAFERVGLRCDITVWKSVQRFHEARFWALAPAS